jgi:hypothetical protein
MRLVGVRVVLDEAMVKEVEMVAMLYERGGSGIM